jgi:hypothetical protein
VRRALEREVEAAIAPSAVEIVWPKSLAHAVSVRLAVIRLRGACRADAPVLPSVRIPLSSEALGSTEVVEGKVLPFADIHCDAVRKLIDSDLQAAPTAGRDEMLGRALGRVAAHELYHMLARTRRHGREGLARPAQTSAELLAPRETFTEADQRKLAASNDGYPPDSSIETGR